MTMGFNFNLQKGSTFKIEKDDLTNIKVELTWDGADLDLSAFMIGGDGMIVEEADFVFYNSETREKPFSREEFGNKPSWRKTTRPMSGDGSVLGSLDEREGGRETMLIDLSKVRPQIEEIVICATIHEANETFKDINNPKLVILNSDSGEKLATFNLDDDFSAETALVAGSLKIDDDGEWQFNAVGTGYNGGLQTLVTMYAE